MPSDPKANLRRLKPGTPGKRRMGRWFAPRVDHYGQITVRTYLYSVPVRLIGKTLRELLPASELLVFDDGEEVARHEGLTTQGGSRLVLDHCLETLVRKPSAFFSGTDSYRLAQSPGPASGCRLTRRPFQQPLVRAVAGPVSWRHGG